MNRKGKEIGKKLVGCTPAHSGPFTMCAARNWEHSIKLDPLKGMPIARASTRLQVVYKF